MKKYFAYGSNLDFLHFKRRCSSAIFSEKAFLEGYKLNFPQYDIEWGGGVAGIIPSVNSIVEGVIYKISDLDLEKLDHYEDVEKGDYKRRLIIAKNIFGKLINAWTYLPKGTGEDNFKPTEAYKNLILKGAIASDLSESYVNFLSNI
jgi:gamma-glutamylcyclotransferase